ncbi:sperm flagellar protein 2 [Gracilinanus agilis]|uniref:sperm flagellar protein 2 n=1 Tax=Gracilinanus agilis TaxID=191870 RepID=UPI001CFC9708|nr:sperm flagellar protein 2 [Gracilinanus agilis]
MSDILCRWLNQEVKLSRIVSPKGLEKDFSNGFLLGELLHKYELQDDFPLFSEGRVSNAKLNNFSRLEPTFQLLGVQFDQNVAQNIMTEKHGSVTILLYQLYIALQKKRKSGLTGVAMQTMRPLAPAKLQTMKSEIYRERLKNLVPRQTDLNLRRVSEKFEAKYKKMEEKIARVHFQNIRKFEKFQEEQRIQDLEKQRLGRRRQHEMMARIQAAILQIPKAVPNRTLKSIEIHKMMMKKKEEEDVLNEIQKFEMLIKKELEAKGSGSKVPSAAQTTADLLSTYSDEEYIKKIQKRLEEDTLAREQREKRRRKLLMDQLIAHEAQENLTGEWVLPEEMADVPLPSNNNILGHVIRVVHEKVYPPKPASVPIQLPSSSIKGCMLGKTCSGKTSCLKILEEAFHIETLSMDTLVQDAIQAFLRNETVTEVDTQKEEITEVQDNKDSRTMTIAEIVSTDEQKDAPPEVEVIIKPPSTQDVRIRLSNRAQLGSKCEKLLKKGRSIPDVLLVQIMVNAINQISSEKGWILDGFPMTINQAKLLEEALTGFNADQPEHDTKTHRKSTLVFDPSAPKELPPPPPAFDFVMLLDITDTLVLNRVMGEEKRTTDTTGIPESATSEMFPEEQEKFELLRDQIQHRILGFLDNWPELEKWFSEKQDILITVNAEVDKRALATKVQELFIAELRKKEAKAKKKLEEQEDEKKKKEALPPEPPTPPPPEPEEKEIKEVKGKGKGKGKGAKEAKGKKETSPKGKDTGKEAKAQKSETSSKGKGRSPDKRSPEDKTSPPAAPGPPPVKPGSEDWVYVDEPLPQVELNRFQDIKTFLQDYYRGMEGKIPTDLAKSGYTRVPLIDLEEEEMEATSKIPVIPRRQPSPEGLLSKPRSKLSLRGGRPDYCIENVQLKFERDEKTVLSIWQNTSSAINLLVNSEMQLRKLEDDRENKPTSTKEKSPQDGGKGAKGAKKKPEKKKAPSPVEAVSIVLTPEEQEALDKRNELKMKIKEEHITALQCEAQASIFRLELIKIKALSYMEELLGRAIEVYKLMDKWLGARYLAEMASVEKLTEVAHYHIETSTRIQNELILNDEDFYINGDVKVFPDPLPPVRPPPVEKEMNTFLTLEQLNTLRKEFMQMAPKAKTPWKYFKKGGSSVDTRRHAEEKKRLRNLDYYLPKRNNQFLKIWLKKYPWLLYDDSSDLMFCGLCRKHGVNSGGNQVSFFYGTNNFRTEFLQAHDNSEAHTKAVLAEATGVSSLTDAAKEQMLKNRNKVILGRIENLFRTCHAIAKTGRPLKDFVWMCKLDDMKGVDVGPIFRTDKSARTFIYFIAEVERISLREKLEKCKFFSLISDGGSDNFIEDTKVVYIQFAYEGKVCCQVVGVQTVDKIEPVAIKSAIEKTLEMNLQLNLSSKDWSKKLVGFGSDGASVMVAENNGVARLLKEIQPCVQTVHCFAHRLELAYQEALQSIQLYRTMNDLLQNIYYFYRDSPSNTNALIAAFEDLKIRPVIPSRVGNNRWLPRLQMALQIFLKGYSPIVKQLKTMQEGRSSTDHQKAQKLLQFLLQAEVVRFAHFLLDVINVLSILSRVNQDRNSSIGDVFATLQSTLGTLNMYKKRPGPKERLAESATHFHGNQLTGNGNISEVRNTVLTNLSKHLHDCFSDASHDVVRATTIGSFKLWPRKIDQEFGEKEVSILTKHYEPVLEGANVKIDEVDTEWSMMKLEIYDRFQNIRKLTWDIVNSIYSYKYPNILTLVDLVLTLPASSAEAERGFSQMKLTKSQMYFKMGPENMTDILIIQLNSPDINKFDPKKAIHLWNTSWQRNTLPPVDHTITNSDCSSSSDSLYESD